MNILPKLSYFILVICIAVLPLFGHLNETPLQLYDEQRLANNALEMANSGDWITTTFHGQPDYWNPKPPLMIWLQAFNLQLFGYNELSLRLPSAIAALLTCILLFGFCRELLKKQLLGIITIIALVSSSGYVMLHGTRTGDYDALLTLFLTGSGLYYFAFLQWSEKKFLNIAFLFLALAFLTKGIAVLMILPGLFLYTLWTRKLRVVLKTKQFYIGGLLSIAPVLLYFILRQRADPGFLKAFWELDVSGRFFHSLNNAPLPFSFYVKDIAVRGFLFWWPIAVAGIGTAFFLKDVLLKRFVVFATIFSICFLVIISTARTKFLWYALPAYPFMSVLAAAPIYLLVRSLQGFSFFRGKWFARLLPAAIVVMIAFVPFRAILRETLNPQTEAWDAENQEMGFFLQSALRGTRNIADCKLLMDYSESNLTWYIRIMELKGMRVNHTNQFDQVHAGDKVAVYSDETKDYLKRHYYIWVVEDFRAVSIYKLDSVRR